MRRIGCWIIAGLFFMTATIAWAQGQSNLDRMAGSLQKSSGQEKRSSAAMAKIWVEKADKYVKEQGVKAAIAEFNKPDGLFVKDDLYITVIDFNGVMVAYPRNTKIIGQNQSGLKDVEGKFFIKEMAAVAKTKGFGWVDYKHPHPHTKAVEQKTTYVKRITGANMFLACGAHK